MILESLHSCYIMLHLFARLQTDGAEEGSDRASGESDRKEESHRAAVRDGHH